MYPKIWTQFLEEIKEFKRSPLGVNNHFAILKERFLIIHSALCFNHNAPDKKKDRVAEMVFTSEDLTGVEKLLQNLETSILGRTYATVVHSVQSVTSGAFSSRYRTAKGDANRMPDIKFLADLPNLVSSEPSLAPAAAHIGECFTQQLGERVHSLASRWANFVSKAELDQFNQHQRLQATTLANQDRLACRKELLEDLRRILAPDGPSQ
jgi:hypothetical protein